MEQFEKVCKGLECCNQGERCRECPYAKTSYDPEQCIRGYLLFDALALIRQQRERIKELEAAQTVEMPVGEKMKAGDVVLDFYECGHCKNAIRKPWNYCPFCGKAVKWDEAD